jgi:hypothetical protein
VSDVPELGLVYRDYEWEHGLMCADCPHVFREGERFTSRLYAFAGDSPVADLICLDCASGPRRGSGSAPEARSA